MTRKLFKVLKRRLSKAIEQGSILLILSIIALAIFCGIPYAIGYFLISNIPMFEEVSRDECGKYCIIIAVVIICIIVWIKGAVNFGKEIIDEAKSEE